MVKKPTYEELEQKVEELKNEAFKRKRVEEALAEANNIINRSSAVAFLWKNEEGWPVQFVTENVEKLCGYSAQEFMERKISFSDIIHGNDLERVAGEVGSYSKKEGLQRFAHEPYRIITKNGDIKWVDDITYIRRDPLGIITHYEGIVYDNSERKLAEERLKASEQHLAQIINFLPDATMVIDMEGKVIAWNQAVENMTGIKAQDMLGKGDYEYAIPFYGERRPILIDLVSKWNKEIEEKYQYVKKEGESLVSETYDPLIKPGGLLWNKASLLYDHNGEVIGAIESIRDITDKKVAEDALRESEEKFRAITDSALDSIFCKDINRQYTFVNPSMIQLLDCTKADLIGKVPEEVFDKEDAAIVTEVDERTLNGENISEVRSLSIAGKPYTFHTIQVPLRDSDGNITGISGIVRDITDFVQAQEALRESEQKYRQLLNHAPAGIFEVDFVKQKFINVNNVICEYMGYTREEMLSMSPFDILPQDGKRLFSERLAKLFAGETVPENVEFNIQGKDGREFWVLLNSNIFYENEKPKGATVVVNDITDRKRATENLRLVSSRLLTAQEKERKRISLELHDEVGQSLLVLKLQLRSIQIRLKEGQTELRSDCQAMLDYIVDLIENIRRICKDLTPGILNDLGLTTGIRWLVENVLESHDID
ncbi:MAG: PAS domain S-box protein, partial [Deltaproteobacteria bacterium]|nr:PAS domain S-box protein [Deltaproteobacteria bacterium]